jgi:hypothetical protein
LIHPFAIHVEALHFESAFQQVVRKGLTHEAHTDDADSFSHWLLLEMGSV